MSWSEDKAVWVIRMVDGGAIATWLEDGEVRAYTAVTAMLGDAQQFRSFLEAKKYRESKGKTEQHWKIEGFVRDGIDDFVDNSRAASDRPRGRG